MVHSLIKFFTLVFNEIGVRIVDPLVSFFDLSPIFVGFFVTFISYRFFFYPLLNGSSGYGRLFFGSGSDLANKKVNSSKK